MEVLLKACDLYIKFRESNQILASQNDHQKLDEDIHRFISIAVKSISSASTLFTNNCIFDSLINALVMCVRNNLDVLPVIRAFECLEKYFCLLVEQPWKPEFKELKTYGGFYKTKVKSVLSRAETIFQCAGYITDHDNKMVYIKLDVDKKQLLILSFDCFVASEISKRIAEKYNQLRTVGKTLDDAIFDILGNSWTRVNSMKENSPSVVSSQQLSKVAIPSEPPNTEPVTNGVGSKKMATKEVIYPTEPPNVYDANIGHNPEVSLGNFKYKHNRDAYIGYMDDVEHYPQLSQATPEEHIRASLEFAEKQNLKGCSSYRNHKPEAIPGISDRESAINYPPGRLQGFKHYQPSVPKERFNGGEVIPDSVLMKLYLESSTPYCTPSFNTSKSVISDLGYVTGCNNPNLPAPLTSGPEILSKPIYRPPAFNGNGKIISDKVNTQMPSRNAVPPPVIRELKPKEDMKSTSFRQTHKGKDCVDGILPMFGTPATTAQINPNAPRQQPLNQMRSSSLTSASKKLAVNDSRSSRSMDYSKWQCSLCSEFNLPSAYNCSRCESSRFGTGQILQKTCPYCTLDNDWKSTSCEACKIKFPEEFPHMQ